MNIDIDIDIQKRLKRESVTAEIDGGRCVRRHSCRC